MNIEIEGKIITVPHCTCGKCIVKRLRKDFFTSFPYNKNLSSTYGTDFIKKYPLRRSSDSCNRAKHSSFERVFKEHLPTSLMSTMKYDYKPFKVTVEDVKPKEQKVESIPFFGKSSYDFFYPNWGTTSIGKEKPEPLPEMKVPLRGNSNYKENFIPYGSNFYKQREPTNFSKDNLEFYGKFIPDTTFNTSFKPVDFNQPQYFSKEKFRKNEIEKSVLIPADFTTPNTFYQTDYIPYDSRCKLAEYLKQRGMKALEI